MHDRSPASGRGGFLARLSMIETLVLAAIGLLAVAGIMLVGKGVYIKAMAELPALMLRRDFIALPQKTVDVSNVLEHRDAAATIRTAG